jgi:hypothetical protein
VRRAGTQEAVDLIRRDPMLRVSRTPRRLEPHLRMNAATPLTAALPPNLRERLDVVRRSAASYLKYIIVLFPEYTDHSMEHPERALSILDSWLLDAEQKEYFIANPWASFFLHAGLFLHDIVHPKSSLMVPKSSLMVRG